MQNTLSNIFKIIYLFSLIIFLIIYLYPGSIIGYIFYGDIRIQPDLIENPMGTSINHILAFTYIASIALLTSSKKGIKTTILFFLLLSIFLELTHLFIPYRSFEVLDLIANLIGTMISFFILLLLKKFKR